MGSLDNLSNPFLPWNLDDYKDNFSVQADALLEELNIKQLPGFLSELAATTNDQENISISQLFTPPESRSRSSSICGQGKQMMLELNSNDLNPQIPERTQIADNQQTFPNQASKLICLVPGCKNKTGFSHEKELQRHSKEHNPESQKWYCGCCRNMGISKGWYRKDKLRDHMKKVHRVPSLKSDHYNQECPQDCCYTLLFTTNSCVSEHLKQDHSDLGNAPAVSVGGMKTQSDELGLHECRCSVASKESQKHSLTAPIQSVIKRGRHNSTSNNFVQQGDRPLDIYVNSTFWQDPFSSVRPPPSMSHSEINQCYVPTHGPYLNGSTINSSEPMIDHYLNPRSQNDTIQDQLVLYEQAPGSGATNTTYVTDLYTNPIIGASYSETVVRRDVGGIHPIEFLIIYRFEVFHAIESALRQPNTVDHSIDNTPITYVARKRTIVLEGNGDKIDAAVKCLQTLREHFSKSWGLEYLSRCNANHSHFQLPRGSINNELNTKEGKGEDSVRIFALSPKTNRKSIAVWTKSLRPAIDEILTERLGQTYSASLVRRSQTDIQAELCILVESPNIPGQDAQESIRDALRDICSDNNHHPIQIKFLEGAIRKLYGSEDNNSGVKASQEPRIKFNFNRPCSHPGMGASLGLLCSTKVSATLGGYIEILGRTYMLTSDHFITEALGDDPTEDNAQITSPSPFDLLGMLNSLKQTKRDLYAKVDLLCKRTEHWDRPTQHSELSRTPGLEHVRGEWLGINQRIEQLDKPHKDFAIGNVFRRTTEEPRTALSPISGIPLSHQMDWCICEVNERVGKNQHKYQSNQDAMIDDYILEKDRVKNPGELCYETCDIDPGAEVYYVGQKSGYRSGTVSPTIVATSKETSNGSEQYSEWAIVGEQGSVRLESVEGDSGAWVIRRRGNKLMGQVVAHSAGQVLFTPIRVLFEDIKARLALSDDITLPFPLGNPPSGHSDALTNQIQLCAIKERPDVQIYSWLEQKTMKYIYRDRCLTTDDNSCFRTNPPTFQRLKETNDGTDDESCSELSNFEWAPPSPALSLTTPLSTPDAEHDMSSTFRLPGPTEPLGGQHKCVDVCKDPVIETTGDSDGSSRQDIREHSMNQDPAPISSTSEASGLHSSFPSTSRSEAILRSLTWPAVKEKNTQTKYGRPDRTPVNFQRYCLNLEVCAKWEATETDSFIFRDSDLFDWAKGALIIQEHLHARKRTPNLRSKFDSFNKHTFPSRPEFRTRLP